MTHYSDPVRTASSGEAQKRYVVFAWGECGRQVGVEDPTRPDAGQTWECAHGQEWGDADPVRIEVVNATLLDQATERAERAEQERDRAIEQRENSNETSVREALRAERAEGDRDHYKRNLEAAEQRVAELEAALQEVSSYLRLKPGESHQRMGEACGVDACILCLAGSIVRDALARSVAEGEERT